MARIGLRALPCAALLLVAPAAGAQGGSPPDKVIDAQLLVQMTALEGEKYLIERQPGKAVELLEGRLPEVQANRRYLLVLRDAYRAYVNELKVKNQTALAEKYLGRLRILEGQDPERPQQAAAPPAAQPPKPVQADSSPAPAAAPSAPAAPPVPAALASGIPSAPDTKARAKVETEDVAIGAKRKEADGLRAEGDGEFARRRFAEAKQFYERAHQADRAAVEPSSDKWAYCKLHHVVERVNGGAKGVDLAELEREVKTALALAPHLEKTGKWLLEEIEARRGGQPAGDKAAAPCPVQHHERNAQGWEVAESPHFRVHHRQARELAEKVARGAEQTRVAMYRKWFGKDGEAWQPKCDVFLHASADEYSRQTGVSSESPGHSHIETDPGAKRVVSRRIHLHCQNPTLLTSVLPHETTHVVLAGEFDGRQVPRWADEGMAVLSEPAEKVEEHRRNLAKCAGDTKVTLTVRELMELQDYPQRHRITAFYAQSVALVDYLTRLKGAVTFSQFVRDGLRQGYEASLRRHYDIQSYADLQDRWGRQMTAELGGGAGGVAGR